MEVVAESNIVSHITLPELIRSFVEYCADRGITRFPPFISGRAPWQMLLYSLSAFEDLFPELEQCIGEFNWDGSYPDCQNWQQVIYSVTLTGYCYMYGTRSEFDRTVKRLVNPLAFTHPALLEFMFHKAKGIDGFFTES